MGDNTDKRRVKTLPRDPEERVRFTLDLSKDQHAFLRRFAFDQNADASAVLRTLLTQLEEDDALARTNKAKLKS